MIQAGHYIDASYALGVAGAAYVWPPLALILAAAYLGILAYLHYRSEQSTDSEPVPAPEA